MLSCLKIKQDESPKLLGVMLDCTLLGVNTSITLFQISVEQLISFVVHPLIHQICSKFSFVVLSLLLWSGHLLQIELRKPQVVQNKKAQLVLGW